LTDRSIDNLGIEPKQSEVKHTLTQSDKWVMPVSVFHSLVSNGIWRRIPLPNMDIYTAASAMPKDTHEFGPR